MKTLIRMIATLGILVAVPAFAAPDFAKKEAKITDKAATKQAKLDAKVASGKGNADALARKQEKLTTKTQSKLDKLAGKQAKFDARAAK